MDIDQLETAWEQVHELGYDNCDDPKRFSLWDTEQLKYDNNQIIGTWIDASHREKQHMRAANWQEKKFPRESLEYIAWRVNSQVARIRTPKKEGGSGHLPTVRNLLHIAYNLGAVGGIRQSVNTNPPPLTNYIELEE